MKVRRIELYHVDLRDRPPRHQLFLVRVSTEEGLQGLGEMAMPYGVGGEALLATARAVGRRFVLGADAGNPEQLWQRVFLGSYWGLGHSLALYGAMSGFDLAFWDIKGQAAGRGVAWLLGGVAQERLELYANHWYGDAREPEEFAARALEAKEKGWRGLKFDPFREHAGRTQAAAARLERGAALRGVARARAVREAVGPDFRLYFDLHGALSAQDAVRWGGALWELEPEFLEEPTDTLEPGFFARVREGLPGARLAGGERLYLRRQFVPFLERRLFDTAQPDVCLAGGITETRKILCLAESFGALGQIHNCAGPVCTAAAVHVMASVGNAGPQEWFPFWEDGRYELVEEAWEGFARDGELDVRGLVDRPGLGVRLNEDFAGRFLVEMIE